MKDLSRGKEDKDKKTIRTKITLLSVLSFMLIILLVWDLSSSVYGERKAFAKNNTKEKISEVSDWLVIAKKEVGRQEKDSTAVKNKISEKKQQEVAAQDQKELEEQQKNTSVSDSGMEVGKVVYLTFDDGPSSASPEILRLLDTYHAKATFFMIDPNMKNYPEQLIDMRDAGHVLGVHSVTHDVAQLYRSPSTFITEMNQAVNTVKEIAGIDTRFLRAPYGTKPYVTAPYKAEVDRMNYLLWDWTIDSTDWKLTDGSYVQHTINQIENLVGKQPLIILLHEKETTAAHLERLLSYLHNNGYAMKPLTENMIPFQF